MVPLRQHMEALFEQNKRHVDNQFREVRADIRGLRNHKHKGYVRWAQFVTVLVAVGGFVAGFGTIG